MNASNAVFEPLVSVVVPCYNVEAYLDQCVRSICDQTYRNLDIILVDDGSRDGTGFLCDAWGEKDDRITVVHQSNKGLSGARNTGMERARGEYIVFIDSDDYVSNCYIETMVHAIVSLSCDFVMCGFESVDDSGAFLEAKRLSGESKISFASYIEGVMLGRYYPSAWAKLFKRSLFDGIGYEAGRLYEDTLFWGSALKLWGDLSIGVVFSELCKYRQSDNSIMHSFHGERERDLLHAWDSICDAAEERFPNIAVHIARRRAWSRFNLVDRMAFSKAFSGELLNEAIGYLTDHKQELLYSPMFGKRGKMAYLLLPVSPKLYMIVTNRCLTER